MEGLRVLIVDDEAELVSALVERLNLRGFDAHGVATGTDALAWLAEEPCDVVALDVKMPGMSGLEVMRRIKRERPHVAVVLLTGHGSSMSQEAAAAEGAYDCLLKPVKIDELARILRSAAAGEAVPEGEEYGG
jgi:two-component system, OmpR family, response regulator